MNSEIARTILVPHFVQVRFIDVKVGERLCSECAKLECEMFGVNSDKEDRVKGLAPALSTGHRTDYAAIVGYPALMAVIGPGGALEQSIG